MSELDHVWKALASPWRRRILDLLRERERTTGEVAAEFPALSRFAIMQHLNVLEEANLIVVRRHGRTRHNYLNPVPIQQIYERWVNRFERHWTECLVALKRDVEGNTSGRSKRAG